MKEITAYQATDGTVFEDKSKAEEYQKKLDEENKYTDYRFEITLTQKYKRIYEILYVKKDLDIEKVKKIILEKFEKTTGKSLGVDGIIMGYWKPEDEYFDLDIKKIEDEQ